MFDASRLQTGPQSPASFIAAPVVPDGQLRPQDQSPDSAATLCDRRVQTCAPAPAVLSTRQQALRNFARELLACDLLLDLGGRSRASLSRLLTDCRALLADDRPAGQGSIEPLGWLHLEPFVEKTEVLRCLIRYRHVLRLPAPSSQCLARDLFTRGKLEYFEVLFNDLSEDAQRQLLTRADIQEQAVARSEEVAAWYRQACQERGMAPDYDQLWARCLSPELTDLVSTPCFALLPVDEQLARTTAWLQGLQDQLADNGGTVLPLAYDYRADAGAEERAVNLWLRLVENQPERLRQWLLALDASSLALVLFVYARNNGRHGRDDALQALQALGQQLKAVLQQGALPDRRLLALPDNSGRFLAHYLFSSRDDLALTLLLPFSQPGQLSVAGDGSGPGAGTHPLHGAYLYALDCFPCHKAFCFAQGSAVADSRGTALRLLDLMGEQAVLEMALGAANRGNPGWWVWLLQCLQCCPRLAVQLLEDPRARRAEVQLAPGIAVPLAVMLTRLWQPFAPLRTPEQQQGLLQETLALAREQAAMDSDAIWKLLDASLILCQPQPCRWLLQQLLTEKDPLWHQLRGRFFDGHSRQFRQLRNAVVAGWCPVAEEGTGGRFECAIAEQLARPCFQPQAREPHARLDAQAWPALFSQSAAGTYGRTVWFRTDQGIVRLKLHKKGEPLADLLREQLSLKFFADPDNGLALHGLRPEPLGCGWLPDFARWLTDSGLDKATQQTLMNSIELGADGAVWGVVMRTPDEGYHHYAHQVAAGTGLEGALEGIRLAARDAGVLLRRGLAPTNLLPMYHRPPDSADLSDSSEEVWQFLHYRASGVIRDWNGSATDHGNVARAPYGLRDWADVRGLDSMTLDSADNCPEQRWQRGAVRVNEAGKLLTGLVLLLARLQAEDFDCTCAQTVQANRDRMRHRLGELLGAFLEGLTADSTAVVAWQRQAQESGLLEAATRQIVFWCETGQSPSFEQHLRAGTLPCDIPRDYDSIPVQSTPLNFSLHRKNTLMDHEHQYPLKQLTALIYLTLAHAIAAPDGPDSPASTQ